MVDLPPVAAIEERFSLRSFQAPTLIDVTCISALNIPVYGRLSLPEFGVKDANANCPPLQIMSCFKHQIALINSTGNKGSAIADKMRHASVILFVT